ncbi:MAG: FkbM family methyltransferase [Alphaproteobacteria bacterium]|jgi:FkbM family methyltransferase|nr:FkbM family methyltransferase [Alphaproteobacteria bacterium]MBT4082922.1 FkbM family methyltransferase [Alphaproteobacteria bacterium]MBT4546624.1 FkbM family methyltransferase [Alphaproteobacteria bacterium]MBT7747066.1 FkbM family methyltransferase [Alphaproteobacteria bacterium]
MTSSFNIDYLPNRSQAKELAQRIVNSPILRKPISLDKPLAIYGGGNLGRLAREYLERVGVPLAFVVDANAANIREDGYWTGVDVFTPEEVDAKRKKETLLAVSVVTARYADIKTNLIAGGWTNIVPFYDVTEAFRDRHPLSNGWFSDPISTYDVSMINAVLEGWNDDISRAHHLQFIAWRLLREEWNFEQAPVTTDNRYFIPEVLSELSDRKSFLDVGAHVGEVAEQYINLVGPDFDKIWAIEPDKNNLKRLKTFKENLPTNVIEKVEIIPAIAGEHVGEQLFFEGLGYASQLSELGAEALEVIALDDLSLAPGFIKMHLEGAELNALKGARNLIASHRPVIAVTTYHNSNGLWALPRWVMDEFPDYKFLMRLHGWCGTGAVLYGLPETKGKN